MALPSRVRWVATAALVLASLTPAAEAHAQWTYQFDGQFEDGPDNNKQVFGVSFSFELASPFTSPLALTPSPCSISPSPFNGVTWSCATSTFEQNGFGTGLDFLNFGFENTDGSGSFFYFFDAGAFTTAGTWSTVAPTTGGVGNAGQATLTVTYQPTSTVPEPTSLVLVAAGLGGLALARRRHAA